MAPAPWPPCLGSAGHPGELAFASLAGSAGGLGQGVWPWLSVLGAWLCFGSFAVPMKWPSVVAAQVHPFYFQCYKTFWTLVTCWVVLVAVPAEFTPWGIASGFSWVPAGVAAVVAVRHLGIACGQAIWQVTMILTSCFWGFVVLRKDAVRTWWGATISLPCLTAGVVGMTFCFHLRPAPRSAQRGPAGTDIELTGQPVSDGDALQGERGAGGGGGRATGISGAPASPADGGASGSWRSVVVGVAAAVFNGVWGGFQLVPSHFSPIGGMHYVISFAIGAAIANVALLAAWLAALWARGEEVPSPKIREMALPGLLLGSLWSGGNICALYAVSTLGQAIGNSLVQCNVIVAGLWGILYYRELTDWRLVARWGVSCFFCCAGVVGLALERKPPEG